MLDFSAPGRIRTYWTTAFCALALAVAPQASHAITISDCGGSWNGYVHALDAYYDGEVPDDMIAEVLHTGPVNLDFVNSISDPENLEASAEEWSKHTGDRSDPPSDYDQITAARNELYVCMYQQRLAEVHGEEAEPDRDPSPPSRQEPEQDLSGPPTPIESSLPWFQIEDFPRTAILDGRQGVVRYILTIDATGKVRGCQADGPEGGSDLEQATCDALLARARFNPATDRSGASVVGEIEGSIKWTIPD